MSSVAARITETNGLYTITDYLGNGHEKSISWKLDQEVDVEHPSLGLKGTQITTKGGPGEYLTNFKESSWLSAGSYLYYLLSSCQGGFILILLILLKGLR